MTTISTIDLTNVSGGVTHGAAGTRNSQYNEMCLSPNPQTARTQYNWMVAHEIPDASEAPGVKHRVVQAIGNLCRWPTTNK
jgi:hypothetical protein